MTISLIACVCKHANGLAIGKDNDLLFRIKEDMTHFKNITSRQYENTPSKLSKNVIVMGRKTWFSLPSTRRPLKDRINIVLTNDKKLLALTPYPWQCRVSWSSHAKYFDQDVYYMTFKQFCKFYRLTQANTFVIGGGHIYDMFLNSEATVKPSRVYLTEVTGFKWLTEPDTFMPHLDASYKLIDASEKKHSVHQKFDYRFLEYTRDKKVTDEQKYIDLCNRVLTDGKPRPDRTGVGTISVFGEQLRFNLRDCVPLLTSKRVPWKSAIEELLWFMRGDTDSAILKNKGVNIWNGNSSREFLDSRGLYDYREGVIGASYGFQWRFFGAKYSQAFADTSRIDRSKVGGFDQLQYIIKELRDNPYSRRALMCYWNPPELSKMALPPCHFSCQFYVEDEKYLNCHFTMRSNDLFLGNPFNIFSYAVLTYIIAAKCDLLPGDLVYTGGDVHIYQNHVEQVREQVNRQLRPLPKLFINPNIKYKEIQDIDISDFDVVGYFPHASIKAPMAV